MEQNILERILEGSMERTDLPLETLREITDKFSRDRIIGEGGFGTVYKGVLRNGNVAVKRITSSMTIDEKLFRREVDSLMEVNHKNVVRFLGFCSNTVHTTIKNPESRGYIYAEIRERLLCFEYISNGSLDKYITDELRGLEWDTRYHIIRGICAGLHYLHMEKQILHMDLKPANVLLDNQMVPKITDFGLARSTDNSQTMSTNHFSSPGYGAPENMFGRGSMSVKSDMYSLGTIIIELVTGHKGIPDNNHNKILRRWRHRWNKSAKETPLAYHQVTECIQIGILCQEIDPYKRPFISDVMSRFDEMERMENNIRNARKPTAGQINPPYWEDDMLGVEPLELRFANSEHNNKQILSCSVELSNETNGFIAFKIETTSPLPYSIEPNKDIVKPRSKCSVNITLPATQDRHKAVLQCKQYTEEFMVRSIKVNEGLTIKDFNEAMFDEHMGSIDEVHLKVVYEEPCRKEVVRRFEELFSQTKYKEAAELAAKSPQDILRNHETVAKFQSVPVQAGQTPPLLQYFGTLLNRGKLNAYESLELSRLVVNQNEKNLLENWLAEDKLECSEEQGDIVKTVDNDIALKIYIKAKATPKVLAAFAESGQFKKIPIYAKQAGYAPDYLFLLQTVLCTDQQRAFNFALMMSRMEGGCPLDYNTITDLFVQKNMIREATAFLLDVLKPNLEEHAFLQTKVLEINLVTYPKVADAMLANDMFSHYDRPHIAQLCEKAGLYLRAIQNYAELPSIKRVILHTDTIKPTALVQFLGTLPKEWALECMKHLLLDDLTRNLQIVVNAAKEYPEQLGVDACIKLFEKFKSYEGLYSFLGSYLSSSSSEDPAVHFKYIESATRTGQIKEVERVTRESNFYDAEKAKNFLVEAKLTDARPLINVCDRFGFVPELTHYFYAYNQLRYIEGYVQKVNPGNAPLVVGQLLDDGCPEDFIKGLILSVRSLIPVEPLIDECEKRNCLHLLKQFLERLVSEGSQDVRVHNALGRIVIADDR